MKDYSIKADFIKSTLTVNKDIELVENDYNSTTLNFTFVQAIETGERVVIAFKKPDESPRVDDVTIDTTTTGHYDIGAILDQDGLYYFTLVLYLDNARLSLTEAVMFTVKGELISDLETITADDDRLPILTSLISEVTAKLSEANTLIDSIETSLANGDFDGADGITPVKGVDYFDGEDGAAATISIGTVTTGAAGSNASVTNAGTSAVAVLNFAIPRGDKGEAGDTPVKGVDYFDGADGVTPVKGVDYFDGENGTTPTKGVDYFDGEDGVSPTVTVKTNTSTEYVLTITDANGAIDTPNLKGADGVGSGDMLKATYDPNNKNADAFSMDNMVETATKKILTNTERTNIANNTTASHSHSNKATLDTYTQTEVNLADAVTKKHSHSNQTVLDNTTASFTTAKDTKLTGIATGAQVNVIETVQVNGTSLTPSSKTVNVTTPVRTLYTATIPINSDAGWVGASAPYYIDISITGITATHTPTVDVVQSSTVATAQAQLTAWGKIDRIVTGANTIRVHAYTAKPTTAIPIQLEVVA